MDIFEEVLFFKLRATDRQKNKQLIQLILCQLDAQRLCLMTESNTR